MSPRGIENKKGKYYYWVTRSTGKKRYEKILVCKLDNRHGCLLVDQELCILTSHLDCHHGVIFKLPSFKEDSDRKSISFRELQRTPWDKLKPMLPVNVKVRGAIVAKLSLPET
ncbi:MAG: hypothetical protein U1D67_00060 [Dehalococcoidia bacterium]|nr:hypothetical protein [Dehalococcoidia bacterium]MDZ4245494.1 hypothetical protein [Dehalococcoidia bacterium]